MFDVSISQEKCGEIISNTLGATYKLDMLSRDHLFYC
jgi:hypothetical protein